MRTSTVDAFKTIKLNLGGFRSGHDRHNNGEEMGASFMGFYWTSTVQNNKNAVAFELDMTNKPFFARSAKANGYSVRCIKINGKTYNILDFFSGLKS